MPGVTVATPDDLPPRRKATKIPLDDRLKSSGTFTQRPHSLPSDKNAVTELLCQGITFVRNAAAATSDAIVAMHERGDSFAMVPFKTPGLRQCLVVVAIGDDACNKLIDFGAEVQRENRETGT